MCELLGGGRYLHPDQLLDRLTVEQFFDWVERFEQQPWGEWRCDLRQAVLVQSLLAPFAGANQHLPEPFYPHTTDDTPTIDVRASLAMLDDHRRRYTMSATDGQESSR